MTIAMVGHSDATYTPDGGLAVPWPDGTEAGHAAIVVTATSGGRKPATSLPTGWTLLRSNSQGEAIWGRLALTAADTAEDLDLNAVVSGLFVLSGVVAFGTTSASKGVTLTAATDAMVTFGRKDGGSPALTPPTGRVFDTDVINDRFSSYKVKKKKHWRKRRYNAWLTVPGQAGYVSIATNAASLMSVELLGSVTGSTSGEAMIPTTLSPADESSVLLGGPYDFEWALPTAFKDQWTLRQIQLRATGAGAWGTVSNGVWYPADANKTEPASFSGSQTGTTLASGLAAGSYEWRVRTMYAQSVWSAWSEPTQFTVVAPPAIGSVAMTAALRPVVSWTLASGSQAYYQVTVRDSANAVLYDSGLVAATEQSMTVPAQDWTNGGNYRSTVQITSAAGMASAAVVSPPATISWTPPPAPTSVTDQQGSPMALVVAGLTGVHHQVRVSWTTQGVDYQVVVPATVGSVTVPLPLAPYGACTYTVDASKLTDEVSLWSSAKTKTATNADRATYLASDDLTNWLRVRLAAASEPVDSEGISVSYPLGADRPVTLRTPSAGRSGTDTFYAADQTAKDTLMAWLDDHPVCYFRRPPERNAAGVYADTPALHVSRTSPRSEVRLAQTDIQMRTVPVSWVEVD